MNEKHDENAMHFRAKSEAEADEAAHEKPTPAALDTFLKLSRVLVGADDLDITLDPRISALYHETLRKGAGQGAKPYSFYTMTDINETLATFARIELERPSDLTEAVRTQIVEPGGPMSVVAKSILALWYCAGLIDLTPPANHQASGYMTMAAPKETFGEALVWKTMGANPMGIPGPYYGNWSYPATTLVAPPRRRTKP